MVSDALVQEIRERADILDIVSEYVSLKRSGKTFRGPCPLHGGEGPNFSVDPARGIFKCFVCGEGGDVFAFLIKHIGLDFPSAVRQVAARVGVEVPAEGERREDPYAYLREVVAFAEEWFLERLRDPAGKRAREYVARRGLDVERAEGFGLGYAPAGWRELSEAGHGRGIAQETMIEAGLLATSDRAEEPYDRFRHRLMFSIRDLRDRPVAFGGRVLEEPDEHTPKYINSPETPIFQKGRTLYGLCWARNEMRREGFGLVAEGYLDVLSLHARGFRTAVAPLGTAMTSDQAKLIARYASRAFLLYDSDAPGLRATFRAADVLLAAGVHPMVVTFPPGEDPDSVVRREGPEGLQRYLDDAVDVLERKLQILDRRGYLTSIEGRRRAVDGLLSTLRAVSDPALLDIYLGRAAERTGVRRETLVREVARGRPAATRYRSRDARGGGRATDRMADEGASEAAERTVVLLARRDPMLARTALGVGLTPQHFRDLRLRAIYEALVKAEGSDAEVADGLDADARTLWEELAADTQEIVHPRAALDEAIRRIVHREQLERLGEIDRELELAEEGQARELLVEKERIARELREAGVPISFLRRYAEAVAPSR